jgi:hypothetical protein
VQRRHGLGRRQRRHVLRHLHGAIAPVEVRAPGGRRAAGARWGRLRRARLRGQSASALSACDSCGLAYAAAVGCCSGAAAREAAHEKARACGVRPPDHARIGAPARLP